MGQENRYLLSTPVSITYEAGSARGQGKVENLSRSGFYVRSALLPPNGQLLSAMLSTPSGQLISVDGIVRWNTTSVEGAPQRSGFGVSVTSHGAEYRGFVEGVVAAGRVMETQKAS